LKPPSPTKGFKVSLCYAKQESRISVLERRRVIVRRNYGTTVVWDYSGRVTKDATMVWDHIRATRISGKK
jgi:hypothetical protein